MHQASTSKRSIVVFLAIAAMLALLAVPAFASSHAKANGSVTWESAGGQELYTEFSLHDRDGDDVRGSFVNMGLANGDWREIRVECVTVVGNAAYWGGYITHVNYEPVTEVPIIGVVYDNATPGSGGDTIGAWANSGKNLCNPSNWNWNGGGTVIEGNLTVMP
jgi:hypothetical protein